MRSHKEALMGVIDLIEKALDIRVFYQRILASNIANAETPGYKEKELDFKKEMERAATGSTRFEVTQKESADGIAAIDGNTVGMEDQVVKMTENTLMFNSLIQMINKKFSMMRYAINEGRK